MDINFVHLLQEKVNYVAGYNNVGQLGLGHNTTQVTTAQLHKFLLNKV